MFSCIYHTPWPWKQAFRPWTNAGSSAMILFPWVGSCGIGTISGSGDATIATISGKWCLRWCPTLQTIYDLKCCRPKKNRDISNDGDIYLTTSFVHSCSVGSTNREVSQCHGLKSLSVFGSRKNCSSGWIWRECNSFRSPKTVETLRSIFEWRKLPLVDPESSLLWNSISWVWCCWNSPVLVMFRNWHVLPNKPRKIRRQKLTYVTPKLTASPALVCFNFDWCQIYTVDKCTGWHWYVML